MASRKDVRFRMTAQDDTRRGFASVRGRLDSLKSTLAKTFAAGLIAGGITALFTRIGRAVGGLIDNLDELAKKGREISISPQIQSRLKNVGELVGVADVRFAQLVTRFRTGSTTVNTALEAIGINVEKFLTLPATDQIAVVINQINKLETDADKTAAAVAIAGDRLARQLVLLAETGAGAFQGLIEEQKSYGDESINEASRVSEVWNDTFSRLSQISRNTFATILVNVADWGKGLADATGISALWARDTITNIDRVREAMGVLADETVAAPEFQFVNPAEVARAKEVAKLLDKAFESVDKADKASLSAFQRWSKENIQQQEQVLDNLISRLERVRDALREDQAETINLQTQQLARASTQLTRTQDLLSVREQQKTNKLLGELVSFARTANPAVFG